MADPYDTKNARIKDSLENLTSLRSRLVDVRHSVQQDLGALATEARAILGIPAETENDPHQNTTKSEAVDPISERPLVQVSSSGNNNGLLHVSILVGDRIISAWVGPEGDLTMHGSDVDGRERVSIVPRGSAYPVEAVLRIRATATSRGPQTELIFPGSSPDSTHAVMLVDLLEQLSQESAERARSLAERAEQRQHGFAKRPPQGR